MFVLLKGWGAMLDRYPQTAKSIIAGVVAALLAGVGFLVLGMVFKDPFDASMVMVVTIGVALFVSLSAWRKELWTRSAMSSSGASLATATSSGLALGCWCCCRSRLS